MRRVLMGINPTPVTTEEARDNLIEEISDVLLGIKCLGIELDRVDILDTQEYKLDRWIKRLEGRE